MSPRDAPALASAHRMSRRRALQTLAGAAAVCWPACRARPPAAPPLTTAQAAEGYVRLALSLARHQPSLVDTWLGPAAWGDVPREPVALVAGRLAALRHALATAAPAADALDDARRRYLHGQLQALTLAADRLAGVSRTFADEAQQAFGVRPPARDAAAADRLRQELSERLPGRGSLPERHAAFRAAHAVPPTRVEATFTAAIDWCRVAARPHLSLPAGEAMTISAADERGWAAFSRPHDDRRSDIWVARGGGSNVAHLLQLAAHEGTPGHHAQHVLATAALVNARGWTERALTPAFGPHRLIAEGAAEAGAELLLPTATRERVCADVLLPAAGQRPALAPQLVAVERLVAALDGEVADIAAEYLDTPLGSEAAAALLRDRALVLDPHGMLAFIERQRSRVLAYPLGRRLVGDALAAIPAPDRWRRFAAITTVLDVDPPPAALDLRRGEPAAADRE
ncbi:MAG: hypothetical protein AB7U83_12295 [Vicinamibacterales bacterium]